MTATPTLHTLPSFYTEEMRRHPLLTREEEQVLARKVMKGSKAAEDMMITRNLRLAVKIAYDFRLYGIEVDDLISQGAIGLQTAAQRFRPCRAKFSTYASFWIRQSIMCYIAEHASIVRTPLAWGAQFRKIRRAMNVLAGEGLETPSIMDLARYTGIKPSHVIRFQNGNPTVVSLDASIDPHREDSGSFSEVLPDSSAPTPAERAELRCDVAVLMQELRVLNPRLRNIMLRRYGFRTGESECLEAIGKDLGITRERVRQLEAQAHRLLSQRMAIKGVIEDRSALEARGETKAKADLTFVRGRRNKVSRGSVLLQKKRQKAKRHVAALDQAYAAGVV